MKKLIIATAKDIYTITGKRGKKSYIVNVLKLFLMFFAAVLVVASVTLIPGINIIAGLAMTIVGLFFSAGLYCLSITRLADLQISKFWAIAALVPGANLILIVILAITSSVKDPA